MARKAEILVMEYNDVWFVCVYSGVVFSYIYARIYKHNEHDCGAEATHKHTQAHVHPTHRTDEHTNRNEAQNDTQNDTKNVLCIILCVIFVCHFHFCVSHKKKNDTKMIQNDTKNVKRHTTSFALHAL